jgi:hypothetical protein
MHPPEWAMIDVAVTLRQCCAVGVDNQGSRAGKIPGLTKALRVIQALRESILLL